MGDRSTRFLWPILAIPAMVWIALFFLVPLYVVLCVAFGAVDPRGEWHIERASLPALEGTRCAVPLERMGMDLATVADRGPLAGAWEVLEWSE